MLIFDFVSHAFGKVLGDRCACCGLVAEPKQLCDGCHSDLSQRGPGCRFCGTPMDRPGMVCGRCLQHKQHYSELVFCHDYAGPLAELIKGFKYHHQLLLGPALSGLLSTALNDSRSALQANSQWVAMPMHSARYRQRGYNQARLLAQYCAAQRGSSTLQVLQRPRATPPLEDLNRKARERAVRGAFTARPITGHWILVDDVFTTGASVNAASATLKKAGAHSVTVLCLARTPLKDDNHHSLLNAGFRGTQDVADD